MEVTVTATLNLDKICRACLSEQEEDQMKSIFSEIDESLCLEDETSFLYEILMNVSSIRILEDDRMPSAICLNCYSQAINAYKFKSQCDRSNIILQDCLEQAKLEGTIITEGINELVELNPDDNPESVYLMSTLSPEFVDSSADVLSESPISVKQEAMQEEEKIPEEIDIATNEDDDDTTDTVLDDLDASVIAFSVENRMIKERLALKRMHNAINTSEQQEAQKNNFFASMAKVLDSGDRVFECSVCEKRYKHCASLKGHFRTHTTERPYVCKLCGKGFKQWTSLSYHARTHSGEQPYACKLCDKRYKQSASLTAHMRVHTGQRPFLCSVCGKGFRQAPDLGYHMRTHTKEKPYMCTVCGKRMAMQCHLVQHMRTHTGEKPFQCKICSKGFASTTRLKRHEIIHTGLKPYKCEVCHKSFNRSSTLRVHAMIHSDTRPHTCPICDKGFIQAHCLKSHLNTHK